MNACLEFKFLDSKVKEYTLCRVFSLSFACCISWMNVCLFYPSFFFYSSPLDVEHISPPPASLKHFSEITMSLVLLTTPSCKPLVWLPETAVCKCGSPPVPDFFFQLPWASLRPVMLMLFSTLFPLSNSCLLWFQWSFYYAYVQCPPDIRYSINVRKGYVDDF